MDNSDIEATLDEVRARFDERPAQVETGLDVGAPETLQLRKACRLLAAATHLERENGYYTVIIETSFAAIERTLQFYLIANDFLSPEEFVDHRTVYERSHEAGLYDERFRDKLVALWRDNRFRSYYREGVGSKSRAEAMRMLAEQVHHHVLHLGGQDHKCLCGTA